MHVCMCTSMREIAGGAVLLSVSGKMLGSRLAARGSEQAQAVRQPELAVRDGRRLVAIDHANWPPRRQGPALPLQVVAPRVLDLDQLVLAAWDLAVVWGHAPPHGCV